MRKLTRKTIASRRSFTDLSKQERLGILMDMLDARRKGGPPVTVPAWRARLAAEMRGQQPCAKTLHRDATAFAQTLAEQNDGKQVLVFDRSSKSWSLALAVKRSEIALPSCMSLVRTDACVTTLFLALRAVEQFAQTPLLKPMRAMLDQMAGELTAPQKRRLARMTAQIYFTGPAFHPLDEGVFEPILTGLDHGTKVAIAYRNLMGEESRRVISPLGLLVVDRAWHVVALDSKSGEIRDFRLTRVIEADALAETFEPPRGFDLDAYVKDGFSGIGHAKNKLQEVVLRFTQEGAHIACDDVRWHPTQKQKSLPDGGVELRFKTTAWFHVAHQIMAYAGYVEAVEPKELRQEVNRRLKAALDMHQ